MRDVEMPRATGDTQFFFDTKMRVKARLQSSAGDYSASKNSVGILDFEVSIDLEGGRFVSVMDCLDTDTLMRLKIKFIEEYERMSK